MGRLLNHTISQQSRLSSRRVDVRQDLSGICKQLYVLPAVCTAEGACIARPNCLG
jgi:hypothetical protein